MALVGLVLASGRLTWASGRRNLGLLVWGLRLGGYVAYRERRASYGKERASVKERGKKVG